MRQGVNACAHASILGREDVYTTYEKVLVVVVLKRNSMALTILRWLVGALGILALTSASSFDVGHDAISQRVIVTGEEWNGKRLIGSMGAKGSTGSAVTSTYVGATGLIAPQATGTTGMTGVMGSTGVSGGSDGVEATETIGSTKLAESIETTGATGSFEMPEASKGTGASGSAGASTTKPSVSGLEKNEPTTSSNFGDVTGTTGFFIVGSVILVSLIILLIMVSAESL